MTIERYVESIPQTTDAVPKQLPIERGSGSFLLFQLSTALVTITLLYDGVKEIFSNVNGGIYIRRVKPWKNLRIDGAIGTSCTYFVGAQVNDRDETDVRLQTTTIAGVTATADQPAAALNDNPTVAVAATGITPVFPANLARRRVGVQFPSNSAIPANSVFLRVHGGANNLIEVAAGVIYNFSGTYGVDCNNTTAAGLTALISEEQ